MTERTENVIQCARCGRDHDGVIFYEFGRPIVDSDGTVWDWWGLCPTTGDPILLRSVDSEKSITVEEMHE